MDRLLMYLSESVLCLAVFYLAYGLVLRKKVQHRLVRFFLLGSVVLSLVLPLHPVVLRIDRRSVPTAETIRTINNLKSDYKSFLSGPADRSGHRSTAMTKLQQEPEMVVFSRPAQSRIRLNALSWKEMVILVYFAGVLFVFLRIVVQLIQIFRMIRTGFREQKAGITYVVLKGDSSAFSFGRYLFVSASILENQAMTGILDHEKAHIRQGHSYDLILTEFLCVLTWFNPVSWMLRNSLKKVHEYLADQEIAGKGYDMVAYQTLLLNNLISPPGLALSSAFHFKSLKQRLAMITRHQLQTPKKYRMIQTVPVVLILLLSLAIGTIISCSEHKKPSFSILTIEGKGTYNNGSTAGIGYSLKADSARPTAMLVREGDLLLPEGPCFFYPGDQVSSYALNEQHGVTFNRGKIFAIEFSKDKKYPFPLDSLILMDLSELRSVSIGKEIPSRLIPYITAIAAKKPEVTLMLESTDRTALDLAALFSPDCVVLEDFPEEGIESLPFIRSVTMLAVAGPNTAWTDQLPPLPKLKRLMLTDLKKTSLIQKDVFAKNPQIETLILYDCNASDYSFLDPLKKLKSFTFLNIDSTFDLIHIKDLHALTRLCILAEKTKNWSIAGKFSKLEWLMVCSDIRQNDFDVLLARQSKLNVLELIECDSLKNLQAITQLKDLKALTISGKDFDRQSVLKVKGLDYLSLSGEAMKDEEFTQQLKEAMPGCTIVPNDGFCMGSGWFIFFLPLFLLIVSIRKRFIRHG